MCKLTAKYAFFTKEIINLSWHLHDNVFMQKRRLVFVLPVRLHEDGKKHLKMETSINEDLSGDLENGAEENA